MDRRYFDDHGRRWFQPGDEVTRDGTDIHVVVDTNGCDEYAPDGMTVRCTKAPLGYLNDDGTRSKPWTKIGEEEFNTCSRYDFVDPAIEALKPTLEPLSLPRNRPGNPMLAAAILRTAQLYDAEEAEDHRRALSRFLNAHIIALGLASTPEEAGQVRIDDVLKAERERSAP